MIQAVRFEGACLHVVAEIGLEDLVAKALPGERIGNGEQDLASLVEVAGHPVGGAGINLGRAAVVEEEDAAVLQIAAHDRADANALRKANHLGAQRAHAADDEVDFDTSDRGSIERFDGLAIQQGVHLGDDPGGASGAGMVGLAGYEGEGVLRQCDGRDEQRAIGAGLCLPVRGEVAKNVLHRRCDLGTGGKQRDIGVEARRDRVVVAGAEVGIGTNDAIRIATDDERELAVCLLAEEAVKDLYAVVLKLTCPANVGGLIEACHELDDDRCLLGVGGVFEGAEDGGVGAGAIERLLDGDDVFIGLAGLDKHLHGVVGVEGMVQQNVGAAQLVEDVRALRGQRELAPVELGEFEVLAVHRGVQIHEPREVDQAFGGEDLPAVELEVRAQPVGDLLGSGGVDLEADGIAFAPVVKLLAHTLQQRAALFFLHV